MTYAVDWIASARSRDDGSTRAIEETLWLMGSPASDLWPEKRRARRVLTLVAALRSQSTKQQVRAGEGDK